MTKHFALTAAVVAILLAGCGGSSNRNVGYGAFDAQLNALCAQAISATKAAPTLAGKAAAAQQSVDQARSLTPPSQLASIYNQWTAVLGQTVTALVSGNVATAQTLATQAHTLASSLGAAKCLGTAT
jgi:hypothetical protein